MFPSKTNSTGNKKILTLIHKTAWKEELLKFQLQDENRSFADLKIKCTDGYFLAHKIVFAMSSQIKFQEKINRSMDVWIVNRSLEETSKIMLLVYFGEILLLNSWTYLDELVDTFQLSQEKLNWGVPYKDHANLFSRLSQNRVRATKCCSSTDTPEEILIYGNGTIIPVKDLETEITASSSQFQNPGYPCLNCSCIFTDASDFTKHAAECRTQMIVKTEPISPKANTSNPISASPNIRTVEHPSQKRTVVSPKEIKCFICTKETNSVMQLVDHFHTVHEVVPGKDYCMNPIKCNGCVFSRDGRNMSDFLHHVAKCKTEGGRNLIEILDNRSGELLTSESTESSPSKREISKTPKRKRELSSRTQRKLTNEDIFNDTLQIPLSKKGTIPKSKKRSQIKSSTTTTNPIKTAMAPTKSISKVSNRNPSSVEVSKSNEHQCVVQSPKDNSTTLSNVTIPIASMNTTSLLMDSKESKNKTAKFVIPKKVQSMEENSQIKITKNGKTQSEKYHNPLKTPENPEKNTSRSSFHDNRLAINENSCKEIQNTQLLITENCENKAPKVQSKQLLATSLIEHSKSVQIEICDGESTLKEDLLPSHAVRKRLFLGNKTMASPMLLNKDSRSPIIAPSPTYIENKEDRSYIKGTKALTEKKNDKNTIAIPSPTVLENNLGTTAPKRKKRKTSWGNPLSTSQQVLKDQNLLLPKPVETAPKSTKIHPQIQQLSRSSSKHKWRCTYCNSKFKSQVFYMRHCCQSRAFPPKRLTIGKQPKFASYISIRHKYSFSAKKTKFSR